MSGFISGFLFIKYTIRLKKPFLIIKTIISMIFLLSIFSCIKSNDNENWIIELPETKKIIELNQWGIVRYALPKLRLAPDESSNVINYLPLGAVIQIVIKDSELKTFSNELDYWYYIDYDGEMGWVFGSFIEVFNTHEEAESRSEEILIGDNE